MTSPLRAGNSEMKHSAAWLARNSVLREYAAESQLFRLSSFLGKRSSDPTGRAVQICAAFGPVPIA